MYETESIQITADLSTMWVIQLILSPGPCCSKLTTSLVNVTLKFETYVSEIRQYFLLEKVRSFCTAKASLIYSTKNISVFGDKVIKHLTS